MRPIKPFDPDKFRPDPKPERKPKSEKKPISKKPTTTFGQLVKDADEVWSKYIRQYYADSKGKVKCFTCNNVLRWQDMHNGHFVSRNIHALRYDFRNCHPQCEVCNVSRRGNIDVYQINLDILHGKGTAEQLKSLAKKPFKLDREHLNQIINDYKIIKRCT